MNRWKTVLLSSVLAVSFIGCSDDGDSSSTPVVPPLTGVNGQFIDAAVKGLPYSTSFGFIGTTETNGIFEYKAGDTVTFTVGKVKLGTTAASAITTPAKLGDLVKSTSIAYLLQNIDIDNDPLTITLPDATLLDQAFASQIDLYSEQNVTTSVDHAKNIIENNLTITLPTISYTTALNQMKDNINMYSKKVSYEDLIGESYEIVFTSPLFGAKVLINNAVLTQDGYLTGSENGNPVHEAYTHYDNGAKNVIDINFDADDGTGGVHDYYKFLDRSDAVVSTCITFDPPSQNAADEIENCIESNTYFVKKDHVGDFLNNLDQEKLLKDENPVTSFTEIQEKYLYRLTIYNQNNNGLQIMKEANYIEQNGTILVYGKYEQYDGNTDWPTQNDTGSAKYTATFSDGKLKVIDNRTNYIIQNDPVIKYNLANTTLPASALLDEFSLYLSDDTLDPEIELLKLLPVKSFTFTSGNMYCNVVYGCKLDKEAFDQLVKQIQITP